MDTAQRTATVVALAVLFVPIGAAAPATAAVPGLQVVSAVTVANSSSPKNVVATCPAGKRVVGTGVYIDGVDGQVVLDDFVPGASTVMVTAYEDQDGTDANWWLRAFAVCADPLPGLEIVTATSASNSLPSKATSATCSSGRRSLGGGAVITGGTGQVVLDTVLPNSGDTYARAYEDADGTTANWSLTTYAICANAPAGLETVTTSIPSDSADKSAWATCAPGKQPLGLGWDIGAKEPGRIGIDVAMPTSTGAVVAARENGPTVDSDWDLAARVVCAA